MPCYICRTTLKAYANKEKNVRLHVFPTSRPNILEEWKRFARIPEEVDTRRLTLCTKHFRKEDVVANPLKMTLLKTAIPCLFSPDDSTLAPENMICTREEEVWTEGCDEVTNEYEAAPQNEMIKDELEYDVEEEEDYVEEPIAQESSDEGTNDEGQQALENVKQQLCRICGKKNELLLPIYETYGYNTHDVPMAVKIEMYLPIKVEDGDGLPSSICSLCSVMVNRWHDLNVTCLSADAALRKIFCNTDFEDGELVDLKSVAKKYSVPKTTDNDKLQDPDDKNNMKSLQTKNVTRGLFCKSKTIPPATPSLLPCCCYCRETFDFYDDRRNHIVVCRELPAVCEFCGIEVPHRKLLSKHKTRHIDRRKYSRSFMCERCARCLRSAQALEYHRAVVHGNKCVPKYYCELCCKVIYNKLHYESHLKSHAAGRIKSRFKIDAIQRDEHTAVYACPVCKEKFTDKLKLVVHLTRQKSMNCPKCRIRLRSEKKFLFHRCKKMRCSQCSKIFFNKHLLDMHARKHTKPSTDVE